MSVLFANDQNRASLSRAVKEGDLRRLARGIYTDELDRSDDDVVTRHRWEIVAHVIPDAVIVDRSAATSAVPSEGALFVASQSRARDVRLPGLRIAVRPGRRLESDLPWSSGLSIASPARALVDNLAVSRGRGAVARTLSRDELGDWVARQGRLLGEDRLNRLRDQAKHIAAELEVPDRADEIDALIGAALGTRPVPGRSRALAARAMGTAYDEERVQMFDEVAAGLVAITPDDEAPASLPADPDELTTSLGFWEAYFSNYIEGTIFPIEQASRIVATGEPPEDRPADGHDILGTYRVVTDPVDRARVPTAPDELFELLRSRHAEILAGRPDHGPGTWKREPNQAGSYDFVHPDLIETTLAAGFGYRDRLTSPFAKALFMFFLVAEVHPFSDGNGRVARTLMNAELSNAGECRILIPNVWRNEYFTAVRQLSRERNVRLYVRTLAFAWRWTASMSWSDPSVTRTLMDQTNALVDSTEAAESARRLVLA